MNDNSYPVIAWWSGGVTSAVTCKICIDWFGIDNVRIIFIDTKNEGKDTYIFKEQCENWYGKEIEIITSNYETIQQVWYKYNSLNVAHGAICSSSLKRDVRRLFENHNKFSLQAFGFDSDEMKRAKGMAKNNPNSKPFFPLLALALSKKDCIGIIQNANSLFLKIDIPETYRNGFNNNNCWKTGCIQGGIGYWQKMQREYPEKFNNMAKVEHDLTDRKGQPVTMLKDSKGLLFLKSHPKYPQIRDISKAKGRETKPLMECNGFCGTNDLSLSKTDKEINYAE